MRTLENPLIRTAAAGWFGLRRTYYRLRYRRLEVGPGVLFIGKLRLARGTRLVLGPNCRIRQTVIVNGGGAVTVGANTLLNGCWLGASERIDIGEWCLISDCNISDTDFHNLAPRERHLPPVARATSPVVVGRNAWVGARAIVLKGTAIGADSVVGSGAVVRGEVPAGVVVAGNPAVVVKTFRPDQRSAPAGPPHEEATTPPRAERQAEPQTDTRRADVPEQRILGESGPVHSLPSRPEASGQVP
jgi:acetyltransferase-like isoleucine patch superfamily enzyme